MKVVLLAGGFGTRISEESVFRPKPMVEIGGMPILWHIMKGFAHYGHNEFVVCAGYKQEFIKEWFANYFLQSSDVSFDYRNGKNEMTVHASHCEPWKVSVVDTGLHTMTGGRVKRVKNYLEGERFFLTYGDGVSDVNIAALLKFHEQHGKFVTITSVNPGQRFGALDIASDGHIISFREKAKGDGGLINGGFMVCEPGFLDFISGDETILERDPMERAAQAGQLMAFRHDGFWQPMDTLREKQALEKLWAEDRARWKVWRS